MSLPGVFRAVRKDGTVYYRASFTYKNKHISLGSFDSEELAYCAYKEAVLITGTSSCTVYDYRVICHALSFDKYIVLLNYRDKDIYIKTPIYLMNRYFLYYLSEDEALKFDVDDLFFYSTHTIMKRQGYLFVADYGMQVNILTRYGIRSHAVKGRDYRFKNGNEHDYRYGNIQVINRYFGVEYIIKSGRERYRSKIHINGTYTIGTYSTEAEAAIAYNKAAALLKEHGINKDYPENYIEDISAIEYAKIYNHLKLSKHLRAYIDSLRA